MKFTFALSTLFCVTFVVNFSPSYQQAPSPDWSYIGKTGPRFWGPKLNKDYGPCLVKENRDQSPINIVKRRAKFGGKSSMGNILKTSRAKYEVTFVPNGVHFDCKKPNTCGTVKLDNVVYNLDNFHFHTRSEHFINGRPKAFEIHMVHKAESGEEAVVGILLQLGKKGAVDLSTPLNAITSEKDFDFDLGKVVKKSSGYFRYVGGLTTPPCTGGIEWVVQSSIGRLSRSQRKKFLDLVGPPKRGNWRPIRPLSGRKVRVFKPKSKKDN